MLHPREFCDASQMFAVVLAGGQGKRLYGLTRAQAKPALHFGGSTRLIDFPLSNCVNSGIRRVAVATQFCPTDLLRHLQRAWRSAGPRNRDSVDLWPASQIAGGLSYAGTADAVRKNVDALKRERPRYVLVLAGDHVYKQNYAVMLADHIYRQADVTIAALEVARCDAQGFGCIDTDASDRVVGFCEKPQDPPPIPGAPDRTLASMGIYIFNTGVLLDLLDGRGADGRRRDDFGHDVIPAAIAEYNVVVHRFDRSFVGEMPYWRDVGTLDEFWAAHMDMLKPDAPIDTAAPDWPIHSEAISAHPARCVSGFGSEGIVRNSIVAPGAFVGGSVRDCVISANACIEPGAELRECVVMPGATIGAHARLSRSIVAANIVVPIGTTMANCAGSLHVTSTASGITLLTAENGAAAQTADWPPMSQQAA